MPRLTNRPPKLCHHKGLDLAMVYINGKAKYLGKYGSAEAKAAYKAFVAEWAGQSTPVAPADLVPVIAPHVLTIAEAVVQYRAHAERYYQSREVDNLQEANPADAREVRLSADGRLRADPTPKPTQFMGRAGTRPEHDQRAGDSAQAVLPVGLLLRADSDGRSRSTEYRRVADAGAGRRRDKAQNAGHLGDGRKDAAAFTRDGACDGLVRVAYRRTARGGHRIDDREIQRTGEVWLATMSKHKTAGYGHVREIPIGRTAQAIITPWLLPEKPDEPIFSPLRVDARQAKRRGKRRPGKVYSRAAYPAGGTPRMPAGRGRIVVA